MTAGYLLLEDGRRFSGLLAGAAPTALPQHNTDPGIGEVVFQTGMTGYQEVITDPSYRGQIVTFTAPHIGNVGVNRHDDEAPAPALAGIVTRSLCARPSSWRSEETLPGYLERFGIPCLTEVDTRALTRHIRDTGALRGAILPATVDPEVALARVKAFPGLSGRNLVAEVAPGESAAGFEGLRSTAPPAWLAEEFPLRRPEGADARASSSLAQPAHDLPKTPPAERAERLPLHLKPNGTPNAEGKRITLVHCGMKEGIDDALRRRGARVRIVTPNASADEILAGSPDALVLSNGPGDPEDMERLIRTLTGLFGKLPVLGICLGHQVLALALGGKTYKMKFGHHGINHPVKDLTTGKVLVTSQNHGFAVDGDFLARVESLEATHESLNDGTLEGFRVPALGITSVQFHPESCAGPRDARGIFADAFSGSVPHGG